VEISNDPRTYFKFKSCSRCFYKPCDRLRFGGVHPGKFLLVHNSRLGVGFVDCPFIARSFDEVESLVTQVSAEELIDFLDIVLQQFTPNEQVHFRQSDYMNGSCDMSGRVLFIKALWEDNVLSVLRIPRFFRADAVMRKWLYSYEGLVYMLQKPELANKEDKAAATDALADAQGQKKLMNPRWKHVDEDRDKESPEVAAIGDDVTLMASATNFPDNAEVTFDIYDESGDAPEKIDSVQGSVDGGRAEAVWTVADPNDAGDKLDLQFEATAEDLSSGKAGIATKFVFEILLQIDVDDPAAQDDVLILLDENNAEIKKLPVKDMKEVSEDIVRIRLEDIDMDKKYSMIRDYGAEDDGGHDPLFINLTPKELMKYSKVSDDEDEEDSEDEEGGGDEDASGEAGSAAEGDKEGAGGDDSAKAEDDLDYSWAISDAEQSGEVDKGENGNVESFGEDSGGEEIEST